MELSSQIKESQIAVIENEENSNENSNNSSDLEKNKSSSSKHLINHENENERHLEIKVQNGNNNFIENFLQRIKSLSDETDEQLAPKLSYLQLFIKFLWFGCRAFGGPFSQIQMMKQELVVDEKWVDPDRFIRVFAVYQALPGPEVCYSFLF